MKAVLCDLATHKDRKAFSVQHHQPVQPPPGDQRGQRALGVIWQQCRGGKQPWGLPGDLLASGWLKNQMLAFSPPSLRYRTVQGDLGADTLESVQSRTRIPRGHQAHAPSLTQESGSASGGCEISRQHLACSFLLPPTYLVKLLLHS